MPFYYSWIHTRAFSKTYNEWSWEHEHSRKSTRKEMQWEHSSYQNNPDRHSLHTNGPSSFPFLNIVLRRNWTLLKNTFASLTSPVPEIASFYCKSSNTRTSRSLPLLQVDRSISESFRTSVKSRSVRLWNSLPKDWSIESISSNQFKSLVLKRLLSQKCQL